MLNVAAQPGPSCCRSAYLQAVGAAKGGVAALARWATMWSKGAATSDVRSCGPPRSSARSTAGRS